MLTFPKYIYLHGNIHWFQKEKIIINQHKCKCYEEKVREKRSHQIPSSCFPVTQKQNQTEGQNEAAVNPAAEALRGSMTSKSDVM